MMRSLLAIVRWLGRWCSVWMIALAAAGVTAYKPYDNGPPIRSDGAGYHIWTYAFLKEDVTFSWYEGIPADVALNQPDPSAWRFASKYPPGVALIRFPVMAFLADPHRNGLPYSKDEHWACLICAALALVATAALGLATCYRLGVGPVWANVSVLLMTFGTGLFHYGTYDASFSHVYSALLIATLIWLAARAIDRGRPLPILPVVVLSAGLFLVRTTNILLVGFFCLGCLVWSWRHPNRSPGLRMRALAATSVGIAIAIGITLTLNYTMFGKLTFNTYPTEKFNWNDGMMLHVLSAERHGVFRIYPILGVAVIAGLLTRRSRLMTGGLVFAIATYTVLYGHWWEWKLGNGFGHRGFVDLVPFAIPVFAVTLAALPRWFSPVIVLAGCAAVAYALVQMWQYWHSREFVPLAELLSALIP